MTVFLNNRIIGWICLLAISFSACKKKTQEAAAQGKKILSSEWLGTDGLDGPHWVKNVRPDKSIYYNCAFPAKNINNDLIQNSVVLIYAKLAGYEQNPWLINEINLLPLEVNSVVFTSTIDYWKYEVFDGKFIITFENSGWKYPTKMSTNHLFRFIIVPKGSLVVTGQKPQTNNNQLMQYSENELRDLDYNNVCNLGGIVK